MRLTGRKSEVVIPEEMDEVFFVTSSRTGKTTGPLTENGAWNVLFVGDDSALQFSKHQVG